MKKRPPTTNDIATVYHAIKNDEYEKHIYRMLDISKKQYKYWIREGKRIRNKKNRGEEISRKERKYLEFYKKVKSAKRRRRGWENG